MIRWALIAAAALFTANPSPAQDVVGSWRGTLPGEFLAAHSMGSAVGGARRQSIDSRAVAAREMPIVVKILKDRHGELTGSLYRADSVAVAFPLWALSFDGLKLSFTVQAISFTGTLSDDQNSIAGWFGGAALKLSRVDRVQNTSAPTAKPASIPTLDPSALLARALEKLAGTTRRLLKYTCLETVERAYYSEPSTKLSKEPDV